MLCKWTNDAKCFLLEHFDTIQGSPFHLYHSALPLCPSSSWFCKSYSAEASNGVKIIRGLPTKWGTCSRTVYLPSQPRCISHQNNTIAIGLQSGDIVILDEITGSQVAVFPGQEQVNSVCFSTDRVFLASGSKDVKLWDVQTGGVFQTFSGIGNINSVSISADSTMVAAGSDWAIHVWDIQTGEYHSFVERQYLVVYISFLPTCSQNLMVRDVHKIQQWDINDHKIGSGVLCYSFAFSLDGIHFVVFNPPAITVYNTKSRAIVAKVHMKRDWARCCCFSPDGRLIAAIVNNAVYVWDITSSIPCLIQTFIGHVGNINALAFSSPTSLISISKDRYVKFWQIYTSSADIIESRSTTFQNAKVMSVTLQAAEGITITSDSDGVVNTWDILTGLCKETFQTPAKSYNRDVRLINDRLIITWSSYPNIIIWDVREQKNISCGYSKSGHYDLRISGDGSKVFLYGSKGVGTLSTWTGEYMDRAEYWYDIKESFTTSIIVEGLRDWVYLEFAHDNYHYYEIQGSSSQLSEVPAKKPHPDGTITWDLCLYRVQDIVTGRVLFQLNVGLGKPADVQWKDQYLVICFISGEVLVLDFSHLLLN